jgi:CPA2 family monovalent cation:H+ antiporter-2
MGRMAFVGGGLQMGLTTAAAAGVAAAFGLELRAAIAVGAVVALSSTACVLRVLRDRTELDSPHGRGSLAILLFQDAAVVPLVVLTSALGGSGGLGSVLLALGRSLLLITAFTAALFLLLRLAAPRLLASPRLHGNRDLFVIVAALIGVGSAWSAHALGLSPALGAFVAGVILAESPFALRVRSDVGALRALFLTLFFASVGMVRDPGWMLANAIPVIAVTAALVLGKGTIAAVAARIAIRRSGTSRATGLCLAQVGEFSFLLLTIGAGSGLIPQETYRLLVSAAIVSLFATPFLIAVAPRLARAAADDRGPVDGEPSREGHVVVIGYGPAGEAAAAEVAEREIPVVVLDLGPGNVERARHHGYDAEVGDGASPDALSHVGITGAAAVAITLPDPRTVHETVAAVRAAAPGTPLIVRARYRRHCADLSRAGVGSVDEEGLVGREIGRRVREGLVAE